MIYYGDYVDSGSEGNAATEFWRGNRDNALSFAADYTADGGNCTVVELPKIGITGNSHMLFQELNNREIAQHIEAWISSL